MGFTNVQNGDMPFFKMLADNYTMSDNMHQSVMGGTGANHSLVGFGDAVAWTDGMGNPVPPPASLIANPNPRAGTNNQLHGRRQLQQLLGSDGAGRGADRQLPRVAAVATRTRTARRTPTTT